jgi:hypothetical protein
MGDEDTRNAGNPGGDDSLRPDIRYVRDIGPYGTKNRRDPADGRPLQHDGANAKSV